MSTGTKLPWSDAYANAQEFARLFEGMYAKWTIAGSIRRKRPEVGDAEHVVIPLMMPRVIDTMFGRVEDGVVNRVWDALDLMVATGQAEKAICGDPEDPEARPSVKWGSLYRAVLYKGMKHDIFMAEPHEGDRPSRNYGSLLAIRTGPWEFSRHLVSVLKQGGRYRHIEGYVRYASGPAEGTIRPCPTEPEFFALCNVPYIEPERRDGFQVKGGWR